MLQAIAAAAFSAFLQDADVPATSPDLDWLSGCWRGEGFGGEIHECWMSSSGSRLTGMFQLVHDGEQVISELFIFDVFEDGPAIRLKHFTSEFVGWEDKDGHVVFALQEAGDGYARFDGLEYRLQDDGALEVTVATSSDGETRLDVLRFDRVDSAD